MSDFEDAVIRELKFLRREVERLKVKEKPIVITDHGELAGLADDDHTQYLNTTRHDTITRHTIGTVVPHDDHGSLTGLGDNDHPQYLLAATGKAADSDKLDGNDSSYFQQNLMDVYVFELGYNRSADGVASIDFHTKNDKKDYDARILASGGTTLNEGGNLHYYAANHYFSGLPQFGSIPLLPASDPTTDNQAVRKAYADRFIDGWMPDIDTWTYVSSTSFKITNKDVRARFPIGTKIKLTQTTVKYFYVISTAYSTDTTVTITGGNTYSLANAAITSPHYSYADNPQGFPRTPGGLITPSSPLWVGTTNAPLTSTSWDGDSFSTTAKTKIDLSTVFDVPDGIKAVLVRIAARDSGSSSGYNQFMLSPNNTADSVAVQAYLQGVANDVIVTENGICPCDGGGDIYYQITASGTGTLDAWIEIWGYWL